jgi:hypothetical protein
MFTTLTASRPIRPLPQIGIPPFIVRRPGVRVYAMARLARSTSPSSSRRVVA